MSRIKSHIQTKLLAGLLAAVPIGLTLIILGYVDSRVRDLIPSIRYPLLGIAIACGALYFLGLFVTSLVGRWMIRLLDWVFRNLPGFSDLYRTWKEVAVSPNATGGIFSQVVLVSYGPDMPQQLGFTSGDGIPGAPETICVFIPNSPNPTGGRLLFVRKSACTPVQVSPKDVLKFSVSGGNYLPAALGAALVAP